MYKKPIVVIYTDGSCVEGNRGGWAASLYYGTETLHLSGNATATTNNRMELQAILEALSVLTVSCVVHLYSDSQYALRGISTWAQSWKRNRWRTNGGTPVANADLWKVLLPLSKRHHIHTHWIRGHTGDVCNETVDSLAQYAARQLT